MRVSSGIGDDKRCRRWLKTMTSPMLLPSTTNPLPAHRAWSAGSMSPSGLVGSVPLSTAFRPFTPTEPPSDVLTGSQPGPSGSQLTVGAGTGGSAPPLTLARERPAPALAATRRAVGDGMTCAFDAVLAASWFAVAAFLAAAAADDEADSPAVDGVGNGPVSREQLAGAQPLAAGPVKVGEAVPRLVDVTVLVVLATRAAAVPPEKTTSAIGSDNTESSASDLRIKPDIEWALCGRSRPPEVRAPDAPAPAPGGPVRGIIVP